MRLCAIGSNRLLRGVDPTIVSRKLARTIAALSEKVDRANPAALDAEQTVELAPRLGDARSRRGRSSVARTFGKNVRGCGAAIGDNYARTRAWQESRASLPRLPGCCEKRPTRIKGRPGSFRPSTESPTTIASWETFARTAIVRSWLAGAARRRGTFSLSIGSPPSAGWSADDGRVTFANSGSTRSARLWLAGSSAHPAIGCRLAGLLTCRADGRKQIKIAAAARGFSRHQAVTNSINRPGLRCHGNVAVGARRQSVPDAEVDRIREETHRAVPH